MKLASNITYTGPDRIIHQSAQEFVGHLQALNKFKTEYLTLFIMAHGRKVISLNGELSFKLGFEGPGDYVEELDFKLILEYLANIRADHILLALYCC